MVSVLIRLLFAVATLGAGFLLLRSHRLMTELSTRATAEVPGTIVERVEAADNVSRRQSGRAPAYRYKIEFTVGGRSHQLSSYETSEVRKVGDPMRVRFIPTAFEGDAVADPTWSAYAVELPPPVLPKLRPFMGWLFVVVGVLFSLSLVASLGVTIYFRLTEPPGGR